MRPIDYLPLGLGAFQAQILQVQMPNCKLQFSSGPTKSSNFQAQYQFFRLKFALFVLTKNKMFIRFCK